VFSGTTERLFDFEITLNTQNSECWYYSATTKNVKVECLLKCPHCGEEVPSEDASFCLKCGKKLEVKEKSGSTDLILVSALLTIISAAFSAGLGYLGVDRYLAYAFAAEAYSFAAIAGFLVVGILSIVGAVFGILAGRFMLKRENANLSMLGVILLLVSAFGNYITLAFYGYVQYGFNEVAMFTEIVVFIFSILSALFLTKTKAEFV
jgi:hypothetical protein